MTALKEATPELGGNRGAKTEKVDSGNLAPGDCRGNDNPHRELVKCQDDVLLYRLQDKLERFEVVGPDGQAWTFSLLYQAESKFARLISRT